MLEKGNTMQIAYDRAFKKIFGNNDAIQRVEFFLSEYLSIPLEDIKGMVTILESEKRLYTKDSKRQAVDVIADVNLNDERKRVNIELNLFENNTIRNITYVCNLLSSSIKNKESYAKMPKALQINFNNYEVDKDNQRIVQRYFFKNEENHILTDLVEIDQISLAKCRKAWYDKTIKNYEEKDQKIILLGALLSLNNIEEIRTFIEGEYKMDEELKKDIIDAIEEYNEDADERLFYDKELDDWKVRQGALEEAHDEGYELGHDEGAKENSILIAKNLFKMHMNLEDISKATGLSKEELENIKI